MRSVTERAFILGLSEPKQGEIVGCWSETPTVAAPPPPPRTATTTTTTNAPTLSTLDLSSLVFVIPKLTGKHKHIQYTHARNWCVRMFAHSQADRYTDRQTQTSTSRLTTSLSSSITLHVTCSFQHTLQEKHTKTHTRILGVCFLFYINLALTQCQIITHFLFSFFLCFFG